MRAFIVTLALIISVLPALAVQPDEMLADPALEARARDISKELRCLVCRNESIDDSHAPLARDLRVLVRERLTAGDSDDEVKAFLVDRYGEFVLLKPTFSLANAMLWLAGPVLLLIGLIAVWTYLRRQRPVSTGGADARPLSDEEKAELERLVGK